MIRIIVYHNNELIKTYEFEKSSVMIGRLSKNDVPLNSMSISRAHSKIYYNWGKKSYSVCDLSSQNGTYIDSAHVCESEISSGVKLVLGEYEIVPEFIGAPRVKDEEWGVTYRDIGENDEKNVSAVNNKEIPVKAFFIELNDKILYKINKNEMYFGNAPDDDFYVESSGTSALEKMATLTVGDNGYNVKSNVAMMKFKINGTMENECFLQNKDQIEFGSTVFTFKIKSD